MSSNGDKKISLDQIKDLLGAAPLVRGESEQEYWKWWSTFVEAYDPEALSDWLELNELARKHWEQNRLSRSNAALIDVILINALKNLLRPFQTASIVMPSILDIGRLEGNAVKTAHEYYSSDEEIRREAREKVASWGITDAQIVAEAMQLRGKEMVYFDRMDHYRTTAKRAHQKELDRRLQARRNSQFESPQ
jgi:hypothetical protein